ncbi:MAG: ankyrin repeat domain-containing protein [Myxococcaceae bacterium]
MVTFASVVLWSQLGAGGGCTPLHEAAYTGDVPRIQALLAGRMLGLVPGLGADTLDLPGAEGRCASRTPLMVAAEAGQRGAVEELVARGADTSVRVDDPALGPVTAWCLAVMSGHASAAATLSTRAPLAACLEDAELIFAARFGFDAELRYRLNAHPTQKALAYALNASIGRRELDRARPELIRQLDDLHDIEAVKTAIKRADLVSLGQLSAAGARSSNQVVFRLLSPNDSDNERAVMLRALYGLTRPSTGQLSYMAWDALSRDRLQTLEALAESNVSLGFPDELGWAAPDDGALTVALKSRDPVQAVRLLVELGVPIATGHAVARVADESGDCEIVELLSRAGAELNQVDARCLTPLDFARLHHHGRLIEALERAVKNHPRLANPREDCRSTAESDPHERTPLKCEPVPRRIVY